MTRWLAVAVVCSLGLSCASVRSSPPQSAPFGVQADYRAQYIANDAPQSRRFRVRLGLGPDQLLLLEVRGFAGPAVLVGAVANGRARIVLASERRVVDGVDDERFWAKFTGVPMSGELLRLLLSPNRDETGLRTIAGWRVRSIDVSRSGAFPRQVELTRESARLDLTLAEIGALPRQPEWPSVPKGFELVEDSQPDSVPEVPARDPQSNAPR